MAHIRHLLNILARVCANVCALIHVPVLACVYLQIWVDAIIAVTQGFLFRQGLQEAHLKGERPKAVPWRAFSESSGHGESLLKGCRQSSAQQKSASGTGHGHMSVLSEKTEIYRDIRQASGEAAGTGTAHRSDYDPGEKGHCVEKAKDSLDREEAPAHRGFEWVDGWDDGESRETLEAMLRMQEWEIQVRWFRN